MAYPNALSADCMGGSSAFGCEKYVSWCSVSSPLRDLDICTRISSADSDRSASRYESLVRAAIRCQDIVISERYLIEIPSLVTSNPGTIPARANFMPAAYSGFTLPTWPNCLFNFVVP
jgi:hypothetical protein